MHGSKALLTVLLATTAHHVEHNTEWRGGTINGGGERSVVDSGDIGGHEFSALHRQGAEVGGCVRVCRRRVEGRRGGGEGEKKERGGRGGSACKLV